MNIQTLFMACTLLVACTLSPARAQDTSSSDQPPPPQLPISNSPSVAFYQYKPLTFAQQQARYEAEQRTYRMEWNRWIGHSPLRPGVNASYMAGSHYPTYFSPDRGILIHTGYRGWFW